MPKLLMPEQAVATLQQRFRREQTAWLNPRADDAEGRWPLKLALGLPTARELSADAVAVRAWSQAWAGWSRAGHMQWETRQWPRLGLQRLPATLTLPDPQAVADAIGHGARWRRAATRWLQLCEPHPTLSRMPVRQRVFDALVALDDAEFERLCALVEWAARHPACGLRLRQLPIEGLHTKWVQEHRGLVVDLLGALRGVGDERDLESLLGVVPAPPRLRMRVACPELRRVVGGLGDIEAPLAELAALPIAPSRVLIVENLETGLAVPDIDDGVVLMKLGHAVGLIEALDWLEHADRVVYWGDIDTHGFAMLNRLRSLLPGIASVLMDVATLERFAPLAVPEPTPHPATSYPHLTAAEQAALAALRGRRIEQERLPWSVALDAVMRELRR